MYIIQFDFEDGDYIITVAYEASKNMNDEIEDAISSYIENIKEDWEYEDLIQDIMDSFKEIKNWKEVDCKRIRI